MYGHHCHTSITASADDEIKQHHLLQQDETQTCTKEDGSVVITTRTTEVLPDGYISIVVAEAVISAESANGDASCLDVGLPGGLSSAVSSSGGRAEANVNHDDVDDGCNNLKAVEDDADECQVTNDVPPRLEQIDDGNSAIVPQSFAKVPGVEMVNNGSVSSKELRKQMKAEQKQDRSQQQQPELINDAPSAPAPLIITKAPGVEMISGHSSTITKQSNSIRNPEKERRNETKA
jgi:hypothetical protein